jgi:hypothetical protein
MFHVSAFLALLPIIGIRIVAHSPLARYDLRLPVVLAIAALFGIITLFFAQDVFNFLVDLFKQVPYLQKYSAYAVGLADPNLAVEQAISEPTSANHYVFMVGVTVLFLSLVLFERRRVLLKLFAAISYVLYLAIFFGFSPVPAFRFAPFFALPVLASARFDKDGLRLMRSVAAIPFLAVCLAVFAVQVSLVID